MQNGIIYHQLNLNSLYNQLGLSKILIRDSFLYAVDFNSPKNSRMLSRYVNLNSFLSRKILLKDFIEI